jgi:hypothetical protein
MAPIQEPLRPLQTKLMRHLCLFWLYAYRGQWNKWLCAII